MDIIESKFDLPKTKKELSELASKSRLNIESRGKISEIYPTLSDIETENEQVVYPPSKISRINDTPEKTVEEETAKPPDEAEETVVKEETEEEEGIPDKLPQFQFRKLTTIPDNLLDMPDHAGEIEMMAQGQGIKGLDPMKGWVKVWAFLSEYAALTGSEHLVKGKVRYQGQVLLCKIVASDASSIQAYSNSAWSSIRSEPGQPVFHDNVLYAFNVGQRGNIRLVEQYTFDGGSWTGLGDKVNIGTETVVGGTVCNGTFYVATQTKIYKKSGSTWDSYSLTGNITGITSDESSVYVVEVDSGKVTVYKLDDSLVQLEASGYDDASIDFAGGYLYCGLASSGTTTKIYKVSTSGAPSVILTGSYTQTITPASAAESEAYSYLAVGKKLYRLDNSTTQIYSGSNEMGFLSAFDEQISMGGQLETFHTEWEGSQNIQGATSEGDTKFGL